MNVGQHRGWWWEEYTLKIFLTCLLGHILPLIISWTFRILAHEKDQYTVMFIKYQADFLSIALKQTKAGPLRWGTPVLVIIIIIHKYVH